jgi:antitoxin component YwqK of YwqJK toxin-antitoxin module
MHKDNNGLKNGIETCWHPSGKKSSEGLWVDGSKEGKWLEWYENGQLKSTESFKNNVWHGNHIYWHENGQKMRESIDVDGLYEGRWISWHDNGQKCEEGLYRKEKRMALGPSGMKVEIKYLRAFTKTEN